MPHQNWPKRISAAIHGDSNEKIDVDCQRLREIPLKDEPQQIKACEVLARLVTPEGERIKAGEFIDCISTNQELMKLLDRTVLKRLGEIHASKAFTFHAVNLSAGSLNDTSTVQFVRDLIIAHEIPPHLLCFEVTEQVLADITDGLKVINGLKQLGCLIALDDFGTGQNSMISLKNYPVDILKIDGAFVEAVLDSPKVRCIVESMMSLGKNLGLKIVAEYVFSQEVEQALVGIKQRIEVFQGGIVDLHGQGNFIGPPIPCTEFAETRC